MKLHSHLGTSLRLNLLYAIIIGASRILHWVAELFRKQYGPGKGLGTKERQEMRFQAPNLWVTSYSTNDFAASRTRSQSLKRALRGDIHFRRVIQGQ